MIDHPGLRRLLDLDDPQRHDRATAYLVTARELELYIDRPVIGDYDTYHLQAVHRFLHHDVWPDAAGRLRDDDPTIAYQVSRTIRDITPERLGPLDRHEIATQLGGLLSDLAVIDPFPIGTGRAARTYANLLANDSGWIICWQRLADHPQLAAANDPRHTLAWLLEPGTPGGRWRELTRQLAVPGSRSLTLEL